MEFFLVCIREVKELPKDITLTTIGIGLAAISAKSLNESAISKFWPLDLAKDIYETCSKISSEVEIHDLIEKQIITTIGSEILIQATLFKYIGYKQALCHAVENFNNPSNTYWDLYKKNFYSTSLFIVPYVASYMAKYFTLTYFETKINNLIKNNILNEWL